MIFKAKVAIRTLWFKKLRRKYDAFTMVPEKSFCNNLELVYRYKKNDSVVVECGVWKGGMIASMAEIIGKGASCYLFDSFEGLPEVKEIDGVDAKNWQENTESETFFDNCAANETYAAEAMKLSGTTDFKLIKGWFSDTLPDYSFPKGIDILRLDGDWYDSTMECLTNLYDKVHSGGLILVDDYYTWGGCSKAVHDFITSRKEEIKIRQFNNDVCFFVKP